jgi:copper chaperone CopZ
MKALFASVVAAFALVLSARSADVTTRLSDVHLCCQNCVKGVHAALDKVPGVTAKVDADEGEVELTGPDVATVQKATDALIDAGYFGKSSNPDIKLSTDTGAKAEKVQTLKIEGVHLCCAKCVKAVDRVVTGVPGVKSQNAVKGAKSFEVTGDFNDKDVFTALQGAGLTGKVAK